MVLPGQDGGKVPQKRMPSLKLISPRKKTMCADQDGRQIQMQSNTSYRTVHVITASERIFQERNKAYLSNLDCKQVHTWDLKFPCSCLWLSISLLISTYIIATKCDRITLWTTTRPLYCP